MSRNLSLPNERVEGKFSPTVLSFLPTFMPFLYLIALGIIFITYHQNLDSLANSLWIFRSIIRPYLNVILFSLFLLIPAFVIGFLRINIKTPVILILVLILGLYMDIKGFPSYYKFYLLIGIGAFGTIIVDLYRRGHKYYVTNYRLMLERKFLRYDKRELMLENVEDIAIEQGIFGRIFNFGNIIPTSAAGIGTGEDRSEIYVGFGTRIPKTPIDLGIMVGGGRGITGFRAKSYNCFFGVPDPKKVSNLISKLKYDRSEATKLEDIKRILKESKHK